MKDNFFIKASLNDVNAKSQRLKNRIIYLHVAHMGGILGKNSLNKGNFLTDFH